MRPELGVVHSDQPARHGYGRVRSVSPFLSHLVRSAKRFCALTDVKDFVCQWYPSLEVEVPAALLLHVTSVLFLVTVQ